MVGPVVIVNIGLVELPLDVLQDLRVNTLLILRPGHLSDHRFSSINNILNITENDVIFLWL